MVQQEFYVPTLIDMYFNKRIIDFVSPDRLQIFLSLL